MSLGERRKALGYSQETFAQALGVDRTTVGRWESGKTEPQPPLRPRMAEVLQLDLAALDGLVSESRTPAEGVAALRLTAHQGLRDADDMIRRDFLRAIAVTGALAALPTGETEELQDGSWRGMSDDFLRMNSHLWQVYELARSKSSIHPIVRGQITALSRTLRSRPAGEVTNLCGAAGDLFQLAGELAFDNNRFTDAAASYTVAASASKDASAYDLWACALVRHAYLDVHERHYREAAETLSAAERVARRGDSLLSTRHWVASVQAEAHAGMGDLAACERALDEAEQVRHLNEGSNNGGWLRFDGTRLAEERGARYVQLGRLDLAEQALQSALEQSALAEGHSFRRRGVVLTDLAAIGAKRRDPDHVITFGREALQLAQETSSGYLARRLHRLRAEFGSLSRDARVADLDAEINTLKTT
ncbi:helix-turn-helix transcriptional regulator [Streptomyces sp. NBC_00879]|uniref:helix-turn-helix transcriptional regulator n=1 Tax=Streptomyces sp. NBC_00879 TaxID=2975855 RepID=UPI0038639D11|nr:helix-turn-helix transcriptional regulator [Streptomyces sp. NBC_00879]